jgi:hypothetical protein
VAEREDMGSLLGWLSHGEARSLVRSSGGLMLKRRGEKEGAWRRRAQGLVEVVPSQASATRSRGAVGARGLAGRRSELGRA